MLALPVLRAPRTAQHIGVCVSPWLLCSHGRADSGVNAGSGFYDCDTCSCKVARLTGITTKAACAGKMVERAYLAFA